MAPRVQFDPVPTPLGGVLSAKCACGWELVSIQPEESLWLIYVLFNHLTAAHELKVPEILLTWH